MIVLATPLALAACGGRPRTAPVRMIAMGQQATAMLRSSDPRLNDNSVYHLWRFAGTSGQTVQIDMMSDEFDAYLLLQDASGRELTRNDDGGEGLNARIIYTLPATAQYRIVANTYRAGASGTYTLRLSEGTSGGLPNPRGVRGTIARGQTVAGELTPNDPRLADNSVYQAWLFQGGAGETIVIDLVSEDFDAYLLVQDQHGNRLASDDDSGEGLDSRLTYRLPYAGVFRIVANTYREGSFGRYRLSVR
jgi:serine protease Do